MFFSVGSDARSLQEKGKEGTAVSVKATATEATTTEAKRTTCTSQNGRQSAKSRSTGRMFQLRQAKPLHSELSCSLAVASLCDKREFTPIDHRNGDWSLPSGERR